MRAQLHIQPHAFQEKIVYLEYFPDVATISLFVSAPNTQQLSITLYVPDGGDWKIFPPRMSEDFVDADITNWF